MLCVLQARLLPIHNMHVILHVNWRTHKGPGGRSELYKPSWLSHGISTDPETDLEVSSSIMIRGIVLLALAGVCLADGYHKPKYNKCFQCSYSPAKTYTYKVPKKEEYEYKVPKTTYECKEEKVYYGYPAAGYGHPAQAAYGHPSPAYGQQAAGYGQQASGHGHESAGYGHHQQKPAYGYQRKCYPKVEYEVRKGYRTTYEEKTETSPAGGFDPCMGPITAESAKKDGVDDWECKNNCYTRTDAYGNVNRGCYKGEFGVDPNLLGCHYQAGEKYCFCHGDHCNGEALKH